MSTTSLLVGCLTGWWLADLVLQGSQLPRGWRGPRSAGAHRLRAPLRSAGNDVVDVSWRCFGYRIFMGSASPYWMSDRRACSKGF